MIKAFSLNHPQSNFCITVVMAAVTLFWNWNWVRFGYFPLANGFLRGSLTVRSPDSTWCHKKGGKKTSVLCVLWIAFLTWLRWAFSSSRQLCQTVGELLTLTGSDEAAQADVFLLALGETASLTLSQLILGPRLITALMFVSSIMHTIIMEAGRGGGGL